VRDAKKCSLYNTFKWAYHHLRYFTTNCHQQHLPVLVLHFTHTGYKISFTNAVTIRLYISTCQLQPTNCWLQLTGPQGVFNIEKAHKQRKTLQTHRVFSNTVIQPYCKCQFSSYSVCPIQLFLSFPSSISYTTNSWEMPSGRMNALLN